MPKTKIGRPLTGDERLYPHSVCISNTAIKKLNKVDGRPLSVVARELLDKYLKKF